MRGRPKGPTTKKVSANIPVWKWHLMGILRESTSKAIERGIDAAIRDALISDGRGTGRELRLYLSGLQAEIEALADKSRTVEQILRMKGLIVEEVGEKEEVES